MANIIVLMTLYRVWRSIQGDGMQQGNAYFQEHTLHYKIRHPVYLMHSCALSFYSGSTAVYVSEYRFK